MGIPENKVKLMWSINGLNGEHIYSKMLSHQSYIKNELNDSPSITQSLQDVTEGHLNVYSGDGFRMNNIYSIELEKLKSFSYSIVQSDIYLYFVGIYIEEKNGKIIELLTDNTVIIK